jgi:carboxymethylenebutenolidase
VDKVDSHSASLVPHVDFTRRGFVVTGIAAGFALAVQPVSAQTIHTGGEGLIAGEVQMPVSGGTIPGYRAMPDSGGPFPTVLVVHEIFGVHEHIQDICRRLAKLGYLAVAPALFAREGDVAKLGSQSDIMALVRTVPDKQVASDLDATTAWAKSTGKADTGRLAITGFCWGGRQVWLYAAHNRDLKAAAAWYGVLDWPKSDKAPANPIDLVANINAPVLGLYGGADPGIPREHIEALRDALKKAGKDCEIIIYPDVGHGFNADYRPSYRPEAAKDAWQHMLDWFKAHGV